MNTVEYLKRVSEKINDLTDDEFLKLIDECSNNDYKETQPYKDKNNNSIQEEDFILLENEKVCQALRCDDGTLLYEELVWNYNKGKLELADEPNYPDSYNNDEVEIISYNKAVGLLRNR